MNKFIQLNIDLLLKNLAFCINYKERDFLKWKRLRLEISTST